MLFHLSPAFANKSIIVNKNQTENSGLAPTPLQPELNVAEPLPFQPSIDTQIDPKEVIRDQTIEQLCAAADAYFRRVSDPTPWMTKPFSSLLEAPELLHNIGVLLSGLHLGKTMTVLDFGAGSCWFSRILTQLQCQAIACDVSSTALEIGRHLFTKLPPLGVGLFSPQFLFFDGRRIDLPDNSVDRIVCNDAFHHVPNQEAILCEFARILKAGGIAGFSEGGRHHSRHPQSQLEMRNYGVLENDIDLAEVFAIAKQAGFTHISCKLLSNLELTLDEYRVLLPDANEDELDRSSRAIALEKRALANTRETMANRTIFFLRKGEFRQDSRSPSGLSHTIEIKPSEMTVTLGDPAIFDLVIRNRGSARWLTKNAFGVGVVKLGTHLYDEKGQLLNFDFSRHPFQCDVLPTQTVELRPSIQFETRGAFRLTFDLVSENVSWFEILGSKPGNVVVNVV